MGGWKGGSGEWKHEFLWLTEVFFNKLRVSFLVDGSVSKFTE